jgi:hypothetical protein
VCDVTAGWLTEHRLVDGRVMRSVVMPWRVRIQRELWLASEVEMPLRITRWIAIG